MFKLETVHTDTILIVVHVQGVQFNQRSRISSITVNKRFSKMFQLKVEHFRVGHYTVGVKSGDFR